MKSLKGIRTRNDILELQKKEEITITIDKHTAMILGFACGESASSYERTITSLQDDLKALEEKISQESDEQVKAKLENDRKIIADSVGGMFTMYNEYLDLRDTLKKYYGFLED